MTDEKYLLEEDYHIEEDKSGKITKQDNELFDGDKNVVHKLYSVKRNDIRGESCWEIFEDKKSVLILRGVRFTAKERAFLQTVNGMQFIIDGAKKGWNSVSEFKRQLQGLV